MDNTSRRQFDLEEFRAKAAKRELEEEEIEGLTPHEVKQLKRRSVPLLPCKSSSTGFDSSPGSLLTALAVQIHCSALTRATPPRFCFPRLAKGRVQA